MSVVGLVLLTESWLHQLSSKIGPMICFLPNRTAPLSFGQSTLHHSPDGKRRRVGAISSRILWEKELADQ